MLEILGNIFRLLTATKTRAAITLLIIAVLGTALFFIGRELHQNLTIEHIEDLVRDYGYYLIFGLVMLGNMGVPVPEESPVIIAGVASQRGWLDYKIAFVVCVFSAILGDNIGYMIGRKGGRTLILKYGQYIGITDEKLRHFEGFFQRYGDKTVFVARFIAGLRWVAGPLSGAAHMPFKRFLFFNSFGAIVWVTIMTQLGYHFSKNLPYLLELLSKVNSIIVIIAVVIIAIVYFVRKKRAKAATQTTTPTTKIEKK